MQDRAPEAVEGEARTFSPSQENTPSSQAKRKIQEALQTRLDVAQIPYIFKQATLDDFDEPIRREVEAWLETYWQNTLYIWGDVGTGKTHLAAAVTNRLVRKYDEWGRFIITTDLLLRIQESFGEKGVKPCKDWLHSFRAFHGDDGEDYDDAPHMWASALEASFIVLDDIATEYASEWAKARLFLLVNHRYNAATSTILTTNLDPQKLSERIGDRTVSRLMHGATVIHLTGKDRRLGDAPGT